ncbi:hypothetical protein [Isoalcanivorax beigongshangi]|uniref:LPP20 lipoprotein n=1 Tax=Isoalcanivorax beigongshangi TaxID=3238810 RepID=A0ABV4AGI4_9GAMM
MKIAMAKSVSIWERLIIGVVLSLLMSTAAALDYRGKASVPYRQGVFSSGPKPELRQEAIVAARLSAWSHYTSTFSPSRMAAYRGIEQDIVGNLDQYVTDTTVLEDAVDRDARLYTVSVRIRVNEAALNARLNADGAGTSDMALIQGELFSFVFVAREAETVKSFEERRTQIRSSDTALDASRSGYAAGGQARLQEQSAEIEKHTTGGSSQRRANETSFRIRSSADVDAAMTETLSGYGFDVVLYGDVLASCGGSDMATINNEFQLSNEMSVSTRRDAIQAARACDVNYFAVGTMDVGMHDVDPVTGHQRVTVSVRGQVWDISGRLPRNVASVGPVQYSGLGPEPEVAMRNGLKLASEQAARTLVDQLNARKLR